MGFAHLGVLQALNEHNIHPDYVAGASMGSILGVLYCAGYSPAEIMQIVDEYNLDRLSNLTSVRRDSRRGLFGWHHIRKIMHKLIPHNHFDSLQTPLAVSATNLTDGVVEYHSHGPKLSEYVLASASLPGVFESLNINGKLYVDGGILDNLPVEPLIQNGCDFIIAVDIMDYPKGKELVSAKDVLLQTVLLFNGENNRSHRDQCQWYIHFDTAGQYDIMSFGAYRELYQMGYDAANKYLNSLSK